MAILSLSGFENNCLYQLVDHAYTLVVKKMRNVIQEKLHEF